MSTENLVSVIVPVFNAEIYLSEAIHSVFNQTYRSIEIICINDGSKDNSLSVLKSFGDRIILIDSKENCGIAGSRNKGIGIAKGEYLALMDADDIWEPEKISRQMEQFQKNPKLDISFTYFKCFLSPELAEDIKYLRYLPPNPMAGYISAASLIKMNSFRKVGNFNPKWKVGEFIDWFARARAMGLIYQMIPDILLLRRIHKSNTGVTERSSRNDYLKIVKEALDRKHQK